MSVIGKLRKSGERVVILGPALAMYRSESTAGTFGDFSPNVEEKKEEWIYVADTWGEMRRVKMCDLQIVEVDGQAIELILANSDK